MIACAPAAPSMLSAHGLRVALSNVGHGRGARAVDQQPVLEHASQERGPLAARVDAPSDAPDPVVAIDGVATEARASDGPVAAAWAGVGAGVGSPSQAASRASSSSG